MNDHHITVDQATALSDAERAPLMPHRSKQHPAQRCWISTRLPATLEHDGHDVSHLIRASMLSVTPGLTLAITDFGRAALNHHRFGLNTAGVAS